MATRPSSKIDKNSLVSLSTLAQQMIFGDSGRQRRSADVCRMCASPAWHSSDPTSKPRRSDRHDDGRNLRACHYPECRNVL